jgi:hypothetical protein
MRGVAVSYLLVGLLAGQVKEADTAARPSAERLLKLHLEDARSYAMFRDSARSQPLELRREPVYRWTNPTRVGGQTGDVFVWSYKGHPEVIATIFSHPHEPGRLRVICHELHSLSTEVLTIDRDSPNRWEPQAPGALWKPVPGGPEPATSAPARLAQMRAIAREFHGRSVSDQGVEWQLRLLPQPLLRYASPELGVLDGGLFALISSAGTDPEIILLVEARKDGARSRWEFSPARFSDMNLWQKHGDQEVWSAIRNEENTFNHDAKHRFRFYQDRYVPELEATGALNRDAEPKRELR